MPELRKIIMKNQKISLIITLLFLSFLPVSGGCQKQEAQRERPLPLVTVQQVENRSVEYTLRTTGLVEPWTDVRLSFQVGGKIQYGPPEEGDRVSAGDVVSRLNDADYRAQMEAARCQLDLARVETQRAGSDLDRYKKLFASGAISQKNLDDAVYAFKAAGAREGQAASLLKQAELAVEHTTLTSPFSGTVLKKISRQSEMVAAGTPVLVLGQLNPFKVAITVPAGQVENWEQGSEAWITTGEIPGSPAKGQEGKARAVVHLISPSAEGLTGSFRVDLKVDSPGVDLRPGRVVEVTRNIATGNGLWIPLKSVVSRGENLKYAFVLKPDGTVDQREIRPGRVTGDLVQVLSGLNPGERVIVLMPEDLRNGDRVEVARIGTN